MARDVTYIINLRDRFSGKLKGIKGQARSLDQQLGGLRATIGLLFTGFVAQRVVGDIIKVGSFFEQLNISFETMLGSATKARDMIKDITEFALKTPFELKDVAAGAKRLLAFGIAEEKILPTLKNLGDVAAGLSVPIERLILNFGQVRSQSRLTGRELRDFAIAGVPLLDEVAKVMGKTTAEVTSLVSEGKVGFPIVEEAFRRMSSEGGKFFNLMEKQTATTGGQLSNLRDVIASLQNDLFKRLQPALNTVIVAIQDLTAFLRRNIDTIVTVSKIVGVLAGALITVTVAIKAASIAMGIFNVVMAANPITLIAIALATVVGLMWAFSKSSRSAAKSQNQLIRSQEKFRKNITKSTINLNALFEVTKKAKKGTLERKLAIEKINQEYGTFLPNLLTEKSTLEDIEKARTAANASMVREIVLKEQQGELQKLAARRIEFQKGINKLTEFELDLKTKLELLSKKPTLLTETQKKEANALNAELVKIRGRIIGFKKAQEGTIEGAQDLRNTYRDLAKELGIDITAIVRPTLDADPLKKGLREAGITKITSAAPKIFNLNIDTLVENLNINTTTLTEGTEKMKNMVREALLTALADSQNLTR